MGGHSTGTPEYANLLPRCGFALGRFGVSPEVQNDLWRRISEDQLTNRIHCQAERRIESVTAYADGVMGDMQEIPDNVQSTVNSIDREL